MMNVEDIVKGFRTPESRWARFGPYYAMFPVDFAVESPSGRCHAALLIAPGPYMHYTACGVDLFEKELNRLEGARVGIWVGGGDFARAGLVEVEPATKGCDMKTVESMLAEELSDVGIDAFRFAGEGVGVAVHHVLWHKCLVGSEPSPLCAEVGDEAGDTRIGEDIDPASQGIEVRVGALRAKGPLSRLRAGEAELPYSGFVIEEFGLDFMACLDVGEAGLCDKIEGVALAAGIFKLPFHGLPEPGLPGWCGIDRAESCEEDSDGRQEGSSWHNLSLSESVHVSLIHLMPPR